MMKILKLIHNLIIFVIKPCLFLNLQMISCLNTIYLFIILLFDLLVICDTVCSREESRYVREYFTHVNENLSFSLWILFDFLFFIRQLVQFMTNINWKFHRNVYSHRNVIFIMIRNWIKFVLKKNGCAIIVNERIILNINLIYIYPIDIMIH